MLVTSGNMSDSDRWHPDIGVSSDETKEFQSGTTEKILSYWLKGG